MLDTNSPIPFHVQIREVLREEIKSGKYKEKIPSERELMERFSVSRATIREAISYLVKEGILEKIHGKGTFVKNKPKVQEWLDSLNSLTETVSKMGMKPGSRLLNSGMVKEPKSIQEIIKTERMFFIERLRTAENIPIAIERHYYPEKIGKLLNRFDLDQSIIYDLLEKELRIDLAEAEQMISCREATGKDAKFLEIPHGSSVLYVERLITDRLGEPVEYYKASFRPDMYVFRIKTKRKNFKGNFGGRT